MLRSWCFLAQIDHARDWLGWSTWSCVVHHYRCKPNGAILIGLQRPSGCTSQTDAVCSRPGEKDYVRQVAVLVQERTWQNEAVQEIWGAFSRVHTLVRLQLVSNILNCMWCTGVLGVFGLSPFCWSLYILPGFRAHARWCLQWILFPSGRRWRNSWQGLKRNLPIWMEREYWVVFFLLTSAIGNKRNETEGPRKILGLSEDDSNTYRLL